MALFCFLFYFSTFLQTTKCLAKRVVLFLLLPEPTFISASWVKRRDDPDNEKIYLFFREKNSDLSPEADPWISRIARVCKVRFNKTVGDVADSVADLILADWRS